MTTVGSGLLTEVDGLRCAISGISNQIREAMDGCDDFRVRVDVEDVMLQELIGLLNSVLDASRATLHESRDREMQLRAIMETASEGIVTIGTDGCVASINQAASAMFGYEADEVLGRHVSVLMPYLRGGSGDVQEVESHALPMMGVKRDVEGRRKDGTLFPMELAMSEVQVDDVHLLTAIIRDLSDQKQMQCELAQAQKLESVGQLAAGIAHEINTPTQYVGDNTQFLKDAFHDMTRVLEEATELVRCASEGGGVAEQRVEALRTALADADVEYLMEEIPQAIDQSLHGVERVTKIVRAMKEFSHPGTDEKCLVDLNTAIETAITVSRNEWKYVSDVVTEFDADLPHVFCLPAELNQVFLNLIVNAAHAIDDVLGTDAKEKGVITIRTRSCGDRVEVTVRDTGTGIPEEIRSRIFDPFFTTKEVGKGTGQGLAIARSVVVDKHDGTIRCESVPGEGTTFVVELPVHGVSVV